MMRKSDIPELHYITSTSNVISIMEHGILPRNLVMKMGCSFIDLSLPYFQNLKNKKQIDSGLARGSHVNLYINARNKMLHRLIKTHGRDRIGVLRVDSQVLDLPDVLLCGEAPSRRDSVVRPVDNGLARISLDDMFPPGHSVSSYVKNHMPEVWIPYGVKPKWITGIYVATKQARTAIAPGDLRVTVDPQFFWDNQP